jgi:putative peptidoglycan lipid II flippase
VLGYIRDAVVAYVFGAGMYSDAFFVAFRVTNLLRRLVGEGALTSSFIPIFTAERAERTTEGSRELVSSIFTLFTIILAVLALLGVIFSKELVWLMSPGFASDPEKFRITVNLTMQMFPYMVFVGLMSISMGVLNSYRHFAAPALSPVLFNLALIFSVLVIARFMSMPVYALSIGVLIGGFFQFLLQVPYLKRYGMMPRVSFKFADPAIKKIFLLMAPAAFGVGVYQLNIFVTLWFASKLSEGSVSYLYYSGRLMELPIGVFSVAVATAVLPSLCEHVVKKEWADFRSSLSFAIRIVNFVTIPATIGLIILSFPIIDLLFKRGQFSADASSATSVALCYYAIGLVPVSACRLLSSVFYSLKDTVTPVWVGFIAFVVNALLCIALVGPLKHGGLALATSLSSFVNMIIFFIMLRKRFGQFGGKNILKSALKSTLASIASGAVVYLMTIKTGYYGLSGLFKPLFVVSAIVSAIVVYIAVSLLLKSQELTFLKGFVKRSK